MQARRGSPRSVLVVAASLWLVAGCKDELEGKVAADPLEDPWVASLDTGEEEPGELPGEAAGELAEAEGNATANPDPALAMAEEPSADTEGAVEAGEAPAQAGEAVATAEAGPSADPKANPGGGSKAGTPTPSSPGAPTPADSPAPSEAEPAPTPATPATTPAANPTPTPSAEPAKPAAPPPLTFADYQGNFRYSGGSTQRDARDAALEVTVGALASAIRGIARKRLLATNPIENTLDITVSGDKVTTTYESGVTISCVVDGGTSDSKDIEGNKLRARLRWNKGKLVQHMEGKGGARTIVYALSSDRKKLTVHTKITSDRLPEPLVYKMSYTRK